ncbi:MAG: hypothetical protein HFJ75_08010 [Eggerthellaceae bacterium]|nr:hypothetical protein [Eggerthellaceae bacterium]
MATLEDEVQAREEASVKAEALHREFEARDQDDQQVLGVTSQAVAAAEAYARADAAEQAAAAHDAVAEVAADVAYRIADAADHA